MSSVLRNAQITGPAVELPLPEAMQRDHVTSVEGYSDEEMAAAQASAYELGERAARADLLPVQARLEAESRAAVQAFAQAVADTQEARARLLDEASDELVAFAFAIASRIVRLELESRPEAVVPLVRETLERAASAERVHLRLAPLDHRYLVAHPEELPEAFGGAGIRLRADSSLRPGSVVLETEAGNLDGRVETQLEEIERALRASRTEEAGA